MCVTWCEKNRTFHGGTFIKVMNDQDIFNDIVKSDKNSLKLSGLTLRNILIEKHFDAE